MFAGLIRWLWDWGGKPRHIGPIYVSATQYSPISVSASVYPSIEVS